MKLRFQLHNGGICHKKNSKTKTANELKIIVFIVPETKYLL